jgi:hypothetical protein
MMQTSQDVAKRNCDVVASLMNRDFETCIARSTKALEMIQVQLRAAGVVEDNDDSEIGMDMGVSPRKIRTILLPLQASPAEVNKGAVEIFNGALAFDFDPSSTRRRDRYHDILLSGVLLYNTGLCHHVQAMERTGSEMTLRRALNLYSMASALLSSSGLFEDPSEEAEDNADDFTLLLMAIMNNMAHIHSCLMELESAWDCLDVIKDQFDFLSDAILTDEEFLFFGMASTMLPPRDSFVASPAA